MKAYGCVILLGIAIIFLALAFLTHVESDKERFEDLEGKVMAWK